MIDDRSDGGCKDDKLDRDVALLSKGLQVEPTNSRYMFYLAQTYFCLGQYLDSIFWYERRYMDKSNMFEEETWYSIYRIGQCYEQVRDYPRMVYWYMKAINRRPHRIEPYVRLAKIWIFNDSELNYYNGCKLIREGLGAARPEMDVLFVEHDMYDVEPWYCLSVGSYYTGRISDGRAACQKLLSLPKASQQLKNMCTEYLNSFYKS